MGGYVLRACLFLCTLCRVSEVYKIETAKSVKSEFGDKIEVPSDSEGFMQATQEVALEVVEYMKTFWPAGVLPYELMKDKSEQPQDGSEVQDTPSNDVETLVMRHGVVDKDGKQTSWRMEKQGTGDFWSMRGEFSNAVSTLKNIFLGGPNTRDLASNDNPSEKTNFKGPSPKSRDHKDVNDDGSLNGFGNPPEEIHPPDIEIQPQSRNPPEDTNLPDVKVQSQSENLPEKSGRPDTKKQDQREDPPDGDGMPDYSIPIQSENPPEGADIPNTKIQIQPENPTGIHNTKIQSLPGDPQEGADIHNNKIQNQPENPPINKDISEEVNSAQFSNSPGKIPEEDRGNDEKDLSPQDSAENDANVKQFGQSEIPPEDAAKSEFHGIPVNQPARRGENLVLTYFWDEDPDEEDEWTVSPWFEERNTESHLSNWFNVPNSFPTSESPNATALNETYVDGEEMNVTFYVS